MVFSSIPFLFYFLPVTLIFYFLAPRKIKNAVLLIFSFIFYSWGEPVYIVLMLISIMLNYIFGLCIENMKEASKNAKIPLVIGIIINIALLGFFKYADFVIENFMLLTGYEMEPLNLPLPLGISFYTFQAMSYIIDLYKGEVAVQRNIINFGTYVALFPQLIAGPIVRIKTIALELETRKETFDDFASGIERFIIGLGKKVLLANNVGLIWTEIHKMSITEMPVATAWLGAIAFTFQIYFDFSGYSDMAIGLGRMFGFHFLENFNYPYVSKSITEFWRRWHISLSTWFKEYVYIPLGGNKHGLVKQIRNILIVWLLTGFWHGAAWNFVIWGLYFGIILIIEKIFLLKILERLPAFIRHVYTMLIAIISWVLFSTENISQAFSYIRAMFGGYGMKFIDDKCKYMLSNNAVLFIVLILASTPIISNIGRMLFKSESKYKMILESVFIVLIMGAVVAYLVSSSYNPFLYFRF